MNKPYEISYFKALPNLSGQVGRFEAVVSVFGNVDFQGDVVMKGAFVDDLKSWVLSGDPLPIVWSHDWADPFAHVGWADPAMCMELDAGNKQGLPPGLFVQGYFDVKKPFAAQVYDLLKERRVKEWSFAYDVVEERPGIGGTTELVKVKIIEAGPTLKGANDQTVTVGVKSRLTAAAEREATMEMFHAAMEFSPEVAKALAPTAYKAMEDAEQMAKDAENESGKEQEMEETQTTESEAAPKTKNVYVALPGSDEARIAALDGALEQWAKDTYPDPEDVDACLVATYPDHVVAALYAPDQEPQYVQFDYASDDQGTVSLGSPTNVEVEVTVAAKSEPISAPATPAFDAEAFKSKLTSLVDEVVAEATASEETEDESETEETKDDPDAELKQRMAEAFGV